MPEPFVFTRLYLPRPIMAETVTNLIRRLTGSDAPRPLSLEVRAVDDGIHYILGCTPTSVHKLRHLLRSLSPDVVFATTTRAPLAAARRVEARQNGMPIGAPDPEPLTAAIYGALSVRRAGEKLVLQVVLGRASAPQFVRPDAPDPLQPIGSRLWHGVKKAAPETRRKLQDHAAEPRLHVALRIGVDGPDPKRREALTHGLFGSLQGLEAIGVQLRLVPESPRELHLGSSKHARLQLTASELAPLLGWPLGESNLPGVDPLHPKRLPVPKDVSAKESVFALGTAAGPERPIGITAEARLSHVSVLGPTGAGKTEAVLVPWLLSDVRTGHPACFIDPKGQGVEYVLDLLTTEEGERVVLYDPSDPEGTAGFNPLDARGRDAYAVADSVLAVFKSVFAQGWGPRTEDILYASVLTLAIDGQRRAAPHTLLDIPKLLTDQAFRRTVTPAVAGEAEIARFWARYEALKPAQQENEIAAPMNKLRRYLMRRGAAAILGQADPPFHLRDIWKGDRIVLVSVNEALAGTETAQLIGGLICAEVFMAAGERATETNPKKRPGFVYVDEVRKFLRLPVPLESALEISRSYGVGWALFGQGFYQMGSELADAIEINTKSKVVYATSAKEAKRIASSSPALAAADIQELPQYEVYADLLTTKGSSGWMSARTLVPPARTGHGRDLRAALRKRQSSAATTPPLTPAVQPEPVSVAPSFDSSSPVKRRRS
ncbi:type IV secretory system conjugative DNA transfer family protein [Agromyces protaetiae]|uniref:Type IV secretory system conjugative DNA transfer family protein n=1 Tax=Agromyces protaetiae TaxID=2509455 RepID=A0A4V0YHC8_9MICO|nr:type IV secretory system conjugative DNA transfer family protein [Agromyces protaetiae]QAY74261.1 type IV secretory system conjugative DNA transfer family protein [Agromyces protaetiae]